MQTALDPLACYAVELFACGETPPRCPPPARIGRASRWLLAIRRIGRRDPPTVTEGDTTLAYVNGMQVLVKRVPTAELAAIQLYIKGGVRDTHKRGRALRASPWRGHLGGTESLDKAAFSRKLAALGSEIGSDARQDYSAIDAKTPIGAWDETFSLLADTFLHPALPAQRSSCSATVS